MTTPKQPATEAGRALATAYRSGDSELPLTITDRIIETEEQAAAGLLALREAVEQTMRLVPLYGREYRLLEAAMDKSAPAAAEIEARIEAPWREALTAIDGTLRDLGRLMLFEDQKPPAERNWDAIGEAIALAVSMIGPIKVLLREQPATEATDYTDEQFVAELRADGEHELADGVERALRAEQPAAEGVE